MGWYMPLSINPCRECDVSQISRDISSPKYFKEYPYCDSIAAGPESAGGLVLLKPGAFCFRQELSSVPALGGFQYMFGVNFNSCNGVNDILGPGFNYSQNVYLEQPPSCYPVSPSCSSSPSGAPSSSPVASSSPEVSPFPSGSPFASGSPFGSGSPFSSGSPAPPITSPSPSPISSPMPSGSPSPSSSPCPFNVLDLVTGENTRERFVLIPGTGYFYPDSVTGNNTASKLVCKDDACHGCCDGALEYELHSSRGTVTTFHGFHPSVITPGRIKSIKDRYGTEQTYEWSRFERADGRVLYQLTKVIDAYGRESSYVYYTAAEIGDPWDPRVGLLKQITDSASRNLDFQYNNDGLLTAIVTPTINNAVSGNKFPNGTAYVFRWRSVVRCGVLARYLTDVFFPNQTELYVNDPREVDVDSVYTNATPRYVVSYDEDPISPDYQRVASLVVGDPDNDVGGTYAFTYGVNQTTELDRNGNLTQYTFSDQGMATQVVQQNNRNKLSIESGPWTTSSTYNEHNQPLVVTLPRNNAIVYEYESPELINGRPYPLRQGLLLVETQKAAPGVATDQDQVTTRYFYDPIYNQIAATIEPRGNPIDGGSTYYAPQNGGTTPTNVDRSRYATFTVYDYQQDTQVGVAQDAKIQKLLFPELEPCDPGSAEAAINSLYSFVNDQMVNGGLPNTSAHPKGQSFARDLGDINGDGQDSGDAVHKGSVVKIRHPDVRLIPSNSPSPTTQVREEIFTVNQRGQVTTHTSPEGNVVVTVRNPLSNPSGTSTATQSDPQYGWIKEIHVDVQPSKVLGVIGQGADLGFFVSKINRNPSVQPNAFSYEDIVTRYYDPGNVSAPGYDHIGLVIRQTSPRHDEASGPGFDFTTFTERNELGDMYRITSPRPYQYANEYTFDANRNVVSERIEDKELHATAGQFVPTDLGPSGLANVPSTLGAGGIERGYFVNIYSYDLLDNRVTEEVDASDVSSGTVETNSLVTAYRYDANENPVVVIKPLGNTVEVDHDERDLPIAVRIGNVWDPFANGGKGGVQQLADAAVTISSYDPNGNLKDQIAAANRDGTGDAPSGTNLTAVIVDAFGSGLNLDHQGSWDLENVYDGLDRVAKAIDALGNNTDFGFDPGGRITSTVDRGPVGGESPRVRAVSPIALNSKRDYYDEAGRAYENQAFVLYALHNLNPLPDGRQVSQVGGGLTHNSTANDHTDTVEFTSGTTSYVLSRTVYDRSDRVFQVVADNTSPTRFQYDGANRKINSLDPEGYENKWMYDRNSNIRQFTQGLKYNITSPKIVSKARYDVLDRAVVVAKQGPSAAPVNDDPTQDSDSLIVVMGYDSRSNNVSVIEERKNPTVMEYDGASRPVALVTDLHDGGLGSGATKSAVRTLYAYDQNSNLVFQEDAKNQETKYEYDTRDWIERMVFPNLKTRTWKYNKAHDLVKYTDEDLTARDFVVDGIGRTFFVAFWPPPGSTKSASNQSLQYDGLSRLTATIDTANGGSFEQNYYDSLDRRLLSRQQPVEQRQPEIGYTPEFTSLVATRISFPGTSGRELVLKYDKLYRLIQKQNPPGVIAQWDYLGPQHVAEMSLGNGLSCSHLNNDRTKSIFQEGDIQPAWGDRSSDRFGYDGTGRSITKRYLNDQLDGSGGYADTDAIVGFTNDYDKSSNKLYSRYLHDESRSSLFPNKDYDSANRLGSYLRGEIGEGASGIATPISLPGANLGQSQDIGPVNNWRNVQTDPVDGDAGCVSRQHNDLNQIVSFGPCYPEKVMEFGPFGYWRLGEFTGSIASDETGNNDANYNPNSGGVGADWDGGTLGKSPGLVGSQDSPTPTFNGTNGFVDVGTLGTFGSNIGANDGVSVVAWVKSSNTTDRLCILAAIETNGMTLTFHLNHGAGGNLAGMIQTYLRDADGNDLHGYVNADTGVTDGEAHMVVLTIEPSTNTITFYLDGVMQTTTYLGQNTPNNFSDFSEFIAAGARNNVGTIDRFFDGDLQEVAVFTKVLTSQQVMNLYEVGEGTAPGFASVTYDENGNLVDDGLRVIYYDALDRVSEVYRKSDYAMIAAYSYDASNRRVRKDVLNGGLYGDMASGTTLYFYEGERCVEERCIPLLGSPSPSPSSSPSPGGGAPPSLPIGMSGSPSPSPSPSPQLCIGRQYVWGLYIDELLQMRELYADGTHADFYPLCDGMYCAVALTDELGNIVEAYDTDAWGRTQIYDAPAPGSSGNDGWWSNDARRTNVPRCEFIFVGRRYDPETGLYYFRRRYYHPEFGRFLTRDPQNYRDGMNLYSYAADNPLKHMDPSGEAIPFIVAYIVIQAAFALLETVIEAGAIYALGSEEDWAQFNPYATFGKNFALNVATGGIGGKVKTGTKVGQAAMKYLGWWGARQAVEIAGDTAYDVYWYDRDLGDALLFNSIGSVGGEVLGRGIVGAARMRGVLRQANRSGRRGASGYATQVMRNSMARDLRKDRHFVTRWRGTEDEADIDGMMNGRLVSHADKLGTARGWYMYHPLKAIRAITHVLDSSPIPITPWPSTWVSLSHSRRTASRFGTVYEFQVRKRDLITSWWNPIEVFSEELVEGGTRIHRVRKTD